MTDQVADGPRMSSRRDGPVLGISAVIVAMAAILLSVTAPVVPPALSVVGIVACWVLARRTGDRLLWWAFALFVASLAMALVIDVTLLAWSQAVVTSPADTPARG